MRKLLILLLLCALPAFGQLRRQEVFTGTATTSWTTIKSAVTNAKIVWANVINESTTATDTLFIALGADTSSARQFPLRVYSSVGATFEYPRELYVDSLRVKSSGSVPYLIIILAPK